MVGMQFHGFFVMIGRDVDGNIQKSSIADAKGERSIENSGGAITVESSTLHVAKSTFFGSLKEGVAVCAVAVTPTNRLVYDIMRMRRACLP